MKKKPEKPLDRERILVEAIRRQAIGSREWLLNDSIVMQPCEGYKKERKKERKKKLKLKAKRKTA